MLSQDQATKILAIHDGAQQQITAILSHFPIVKDAEFETNVFLFALSGILFDEDIAEIAGQEFFLFMGDDVFEESLCRRLKLYGLAAGNEVMLGAFWATCPILPLRMNPVLRAFAMFGDFLVYPECTENYSRCEWPMLDSRKISTFSRAFTSRVLSEVSSYIRAIADVIEEEG